MYLRPTLLPLLLLLPAASNAQQQRPNPANPQRQQQPQNPAGPQQPNAIRQRSEAAEARRRAGDRAGAEREFGAILAEAYSKLGKIYSARKDYKPAAEALEAAADR